MEDGLREHPRESGGSFDKTVTLRGEEELLHPLYVVVDLGEGLLGGCGALPSGKKKRQGEWGALPSGKRKHPIYV